MTLALRSARRPAIERFGTPSSPSLSRSIGKEAEAFTFWLPNPKFNLLHWSAATRATSALREAGALVPTANLDLAFGLMSAISAARRRT